jgi:type I restriction enzyme S subunit
MSYLEQLLDGVEVEWKTLGDSEYIEIANSGRKPVKASDRIPGQIPYYGANNVQDYVEGYTHEGSYILIAEDGTKSVENYSIQHAKGKFWANNHVHVIRGTDKLLIRFIFHYLKTISFIPFLSGGGRAKLTKGKLCLIPIPIPSLSLQKEIVRILDTFANLSKELNTELTARKKQFTHYRDQLYSFEGKDVEWKTLGELCKIGDGLHGTPKYEDSGDYYFINGNNLSNGNIIFNSKTRKVDETMFQKHGIDFSLENTVFLSINGTIGNVSFYNNENIVLGKSVAYFNITAPDLSTRYLFHFLQTHYATNYYESQKTGSTIKNLGLKALRNFNIPLPSLEEQNRITTILDKFDTLSNSQSEGLPAEIAMRQKQYNYYRNMLLTFPKDKIEV